MILCANFKANKTRQETRAYMAVVESFVSVNEIDDTVIVFPPFTALEHLPRREMLTKSYKRPTEVGDILVTSGVGGIFPPDIMVGIVTAIKDEEISVKPFVSFHTLEIVRILYDHLAA